MTQFPYNEPPHSPPEEDEHHLPCSACGGDAESEPAREVDEDGNLCAWYYQYQCDYCGSGLCSDCYSTSRFCSPECEKEGV